MDGGAHVREAARVLHKGGDGEGARASTRRIHRNEHVVDVMRRLTHVVDDRVGHALHHRIDVRRVEGLLAAVGRNSQRFTEEHGRVLWLGVGARE